jgi:hypothetical protein
MNVSFMDEVETGIYMQSENDTMISRENFFFPFGTIANYLICKRMRLLNKKKIPHFMINTGLYLLIDANSVSLKQSEFEVCEFSQIFTSIGFYLSIIILQSVLLIVETFAKNVLYYLSSQ